MGSTPDRLPGRPAGLGATAAALRAEHVTMVALSFVDNAGITRVKSVPVHRLDRATRYGVGASPCFDAYCFDDWMVVGRYLGGPDGDLRLVPDLDRLVPLACQPGWAMAPADKFTQEGPPFVACQRAFARTQAARAAQAGLGLSTAFENEWVVGAAGTDDFVPAVHGPAYGLIRLGQVADYAAELVDVLARQGVTVEQFHPEYATGQLELSVAARDPVRTADELVLIRHTIRTLSEAHGWRASFAPTVTPGGVGSGCHLHLSVHDGHGNLFGGGDGPHWMREAGQAFLAGVLRELPALVAIGAGNPASFLRLEPSHWAGVWQCWGHETREAALRFVTDTTGAGTAAANVEVKCFDATANPYLVVGAVIAAGLAGIDEELTLPPEITGDPATWTEERRRELGVRRLPTSAADAAEALAGSAVLKGAMGEVLHDAVVTVRRAEAERFADTSPDELASLTRWRF